MAFQCPYCSHSISVRTPKPGRYTPKCPKCAGVFLLTIPADADAEWIVQAKPSPAEPTLATRMDMKGRLAANQESKTETRNEHQDEADQR